MGTQPSSAAVAAAKSAQALFGIPASVQLAQFAVESGWGRFIPAGSNNPFGIKAVAGQPSVTVPTHEFIAGRYVSIHAPFAAFASLAAAFGAHAKLLADEPQYQPARSCMPDVGKFCDALTGVYATDPNYGTKLKTIIADSDLTQYDQGA